MEDFNFISNLPIVISVIAIIVSYMSYTNAKEAKKSANQWHKNDMELRIHEGTLKINNGYKNFAKPYIDIMYDSYYETKKLTTEYSTKACRIKNNICDKINKLDSELFSSIDLLDKAISKLILENKDDILYQNPEKLFGDINRYSNEIEHNLEEDSTDEVKKLLYALYKKIDYKNRKELYDYTIEQLKEVHLIYKNNKDLVDKRIILMNNEYMKFKRYYFGNVLDDLHTDYLGMLNLMKYIKYADEHYHYYKEIEPTVAISKMFIAISNVMIVNHGIMEMMKLEQYRDSKHLTNL